MGEITFTTSPSELSEDLAIAVATEENVSPLGIEPLQSAVEMCAISSLFEHSNEQEGSQLRISFDYMDYTITLQSGDGNRNVDCQIILPEDNS